MHVRLTKTLILSSTNQCYIRNANKKYKNEKWSNERIFGFYKKQVLCPMYVVWVEESNNRLRFEIGPNYDDVPTRSQFLTGRQSNRRAISIFKVFLRRKDARPPMVAAGHSRFFLQFTPKMAQSKVQFYLGGAKQLGLFGG